MESSTSVSLQSLLAEADRAVRGRAFEVARSTLTRACTLVPDDPTLWIKLASMCRATGAHREALGAVRRALALDPFDFVALLLQAELLEAVGDPAAGNAYGAALAQRPTGDLAPNLQNACDKAEHAYRDHQQAEHLRLSQAMTVAETGASAEERRNLARFRSNVVRVTKAYRSDPTHFDFPGLREREFHHRSAFPWLDELEAASGVIGEDLARIMAADDAESEAYVQYDDDIPMAQWRTLNNSRAWTAIHLIRNGTANARNASYCSETLDILSRFGQPDIPGRGPNAMFSLLAPRTSIPPHTGVANTRLVCHLPLIVPPGCWFRVGADRREWKAGEAWVFDDTIEHEACNPSDQPRIILIFDVWHPDLSLAERRGVTALMLAGGITGTGGL